MTLPCSGSTCTSPNDGTQVGSAVSVSSTGPGTATATSSSQVFSTAGTYSWMAVYSGDSNNNGATATSEGPLTVGPVTPSQVTMTVSYSVVGGGSPTAPVFHYVLNGVAMSLTLTKAPKAVSVDASSSWSVTPNPLTGSTSTERWDSNQPLSGSASTTTIVFVFYHQTLQTLSYAVEGGGTPTAPSFRSMQFRA